MSIKEATTGKNLPDLIKGDRIPGFVWEVQIGQHGFYTSAQPLLMQRIAVVGEGFLPLGALQDVADDFEDQLQHLLGCNVRIIFAKLKRVICSTEIGLVTSKQVCVAGLE